MWTVLSPFPSKREGDGSLFCALTRRNFFLRLSMISWGQFNVMERFCDFLKRNNLLIKLKHWLSFLWTTFCPCLWNLQFSSKGGGISCSYALYGICEVIFRGRDLIFRVEPHISIYFTDIKKNLIWTTWSMLQDVQLLVPFGIKSAPH